MTEHKARFVMQYHGQFRFLSNFYPSPIRLGGTVYPTVEHAYQAAKTLDSQERASIAQARTPGDAKRLGRKVTIRADWEDIKLAVMLACLRQKFQSEPLRSQLIATGDQELIEDNTWGDKFWGKCNGIGANHLGWQLQLVRKEVQ